MGALTRHFFPHEFRCHCGCGDDAVSEDLISALEDLRLSLDRPIIILSGKRCAEHNAKVGGKKDSQHLLGNAADIVVEKMPLTRLFLKAAGVAAFHSGGIGLYPDQRFLHVDVRGHKARWGQVGGVYVPFITAWDTTRNREGAA